VDVASGLKVPVPEYHDMKGSVQVVRADGGLLPLFCRLARETGLEETMFPERGDIGLHHHPQAMSLQILAVCLGGGKWAAKVSKTAQVATFDGAPIKCWTVPRKTGNTDLCSVPGRRGQSLPRAAISWPRHALAAGRRRGFRPMVAFNIAGGRARCGVSSSGLPPR